MKTLCKKTVWLFLLLSMALVLVGCGGSRGKKLVGSWYQEGSGKLAFTLYKDGGCDIYTSGIASPGQWALDGDTLRINSLINNERYTVKSLKNGRLELDSARGFSLTLWNSEENAMKHGSAGSAASGTSSATARPSAPSGEDNAAVPPTEQASTMAQEPMPAPATEPLTYRTVIAGSGDLLFYEDGGSTCAMDTNGQYRFMIPDGRTLAQGDAGVVGNYILISGEGILNTRGDTVFELSETEYDFHLLQDDYRFSHGKLFQQMLKDGFLICGKEYNSFDYSVTKFFLLNLDSGLATEIPAEFGESEHEFTTGLDYSEGYLYKTINDDAQNKIILFFNCSTGGFSQITGGVGWMSWSPFPKVYEGNLYFMYTDGRKVLDSITSYKYDLSTGEMQPLFEPGYLNSRYEDRTLLVRPIQYGYQLIESTENRTAKSHYEVTDLVNERILSMDELGISKKPVVLGRVKGDGLLAIIENKSGGYFLSVIDADNTFRFEPIPVKSTDAENIRVYDDLIAINTDPAEGKWSFYDQKGNLLGQFSARSSLPYYAKQHLIGSSVFLYSDDGNMTLVDLNTMDVKDISLPMDRIARPYTWAKNQLAISLSCKCRNCLPISLPSPLSGSLILLEDGTTLLVRTDGTVEHQLPD